MGTIYFRYGAILLLILFMSSLWEFALQDMLNQYWTSSPISGSLSKHLDSVATVFIFCFISLLHPYFRAIKEVRKRNRHELDLAYLTTYFHEEYPEINKLQGMITICSLCKKIREDRDVWTQLEAYLDKHLDAMLSHGLCPNCLEIQLSQIEKFE